ncbi:MAG TPA: hypothetical protein VME18_03250 [Acidobacteriaceae bacterium]|nr:hypothetical protein [Acidobacteriaceae bacterium]
MRSSAGRAFSPGTVCDELRHEALRVTGNLLNRGPDPSTHHHCGFGMIGDNACGARAQVSGKTEHNVEEMETLLHDGTRMTVGWMNEADPGREIARGGRTGEI